MEGYGGRKGNKYAYAYMHRIIKWKRTEKRHDPKKVKFQVKSKVKEAIVKMRKKAKD